jgi:DNA modification methylase
MNRVIFGDCRDTMRDLKAQGVRVQCCVTSPPYFGLRDYGHPGQIGLEKTPAEYVAALVEVFEGVRELLADDGVLWLNLGDSYGHGTSASRKASTTSTKISAAQHEAQGGRHGGPAKQLLGIPWRVAFALQEAGWYLRQDVIWHKPNPMPESVTDRCTKAHEYLFLLTKSERYFFDAEAIKEQAVKGAANSDFHTGKTAEHQLGRASTKPRKSNSTNDSAVPGATEHSGLHREGTEREPENRNRRSVWTVPTQPYSGAHFAVFPAALIEPCILAGSRPGDLVLDPFMGSGTTAQVAQQLGRQWIGCELNTEYAPLQQARTAQAALAI